MDALTASLIVLLLLSCVTLAFVIWRLGRRGAVIGAGGADDSAALRERYDQSQRDLGKARERVVELETRLEEQQRRHEEKLRAYGEAEEQMLNSFKALSGDLLKSNCDEFLKRANELIKATQSKAVEDFDARRKTIDEMVRPVRESLKLYEERIQKIEESRRDANAKLYEQVNFLRSMGEQLKLETGNLVKALRAPQVRGHWGELQLRRVVELAGMIPHCDFTEQAHVETSDGRRRPDMVINLPNERCIVVDAKAPILAYLDAIESVNEDERRTSLSRFARQVKDQINHLSQKSYWAQFDESPEFVVMFLPGDIFLSEAVRHDPQLLEYALERRVIPATPTTLIALLKAVAYGWQQERLAENAVGVLEAARELHQRLCILTEHASKVGTNLDRAVRAYNDFVGSLEGRVLPQARRMEDLEARSHRELAESSPIDRQPRLLRNEHSALAAAASENGEAEHQSSTAREI